MGQFSQYHAKKKKKVVDPNAPPRPTLLGHEKTIKGINQNIDSQDHRIRQQQEEISRLKSKLTHLEHVVETMRHYLIKRG